MYQFASREQFGGWALFKVYQQQMNCQPLFVGRQWCQFSNKRPGGGYRPVTVWSCQVRPPAAAITATRKQA
jgi:hypothetical protein